MERERRIGTATYCNVKHDRQDKDWIKSQWKHEILLYSREKQQHSPEIVRTIISLMTTLQLECSRETTDITWSCEKIIPNIQLADAAYNL